MHTNPILVQIYTPKGIKKIPHRAFLNSMGYMLCREERASGIGLARLAYRGDSLSYNRGDSLSYNRGELIPSNSSGCTSGTLLLLFAAHQVLILNSAAYLANSTLEVTKAIADRDTRG